MKSVRAAIALAITAVAVRLVQLQWLHPLNWDELEFFRATSWIAEGRVPFRDFWEHHTPLAWFLFAPFAALTDGAGVTAVVAMRWAQVPVWIVTFWLVNLWMRNEGLERFARWAAMTLVLSSSLFMLPALEFRIEAVSCALFMAGMVAIQKDRPFLAGVAFCLVGFANLRYGPLIAFLVLLLMVTRGGRWRVNPRPAWIIAGGLSALAICLVYFAATGSLGALFQQVWVDNRAERYYARRGGRFIHRLLVPFGIRLLASDRLFELPAVDVGGIAVIVLGLLGMVRTLLRWRTPNALFVFSAGQIVSLAFIATMKFIFNYHWAVVVIMMIPLMALALEGVPRRPVLALLVAAWSVNAFASILRGKELDRAYQDRVMREVHARTRPDDVVFSGAAWPLRREPAYRYWFLPELTGQLVLHKEGPPYLLADVLRKPPGAVVFDHNTFNWLTAVQGELAPYFVRHYLPVWRELWIPAMNARLAPGHEARWIVPRDGVYRVFVSVPLAGHPWFRAPIRATMYKEADASRLTFTLPPPGSDGVQWTIDGRAVAPGATMQLRKDQELVASSSATVAVVVIPGDDRTFFRQPPPGVTLDAENTRVTHVPHFGARLAP